MAKRGPKPKSGKREANGRLSRKKNDIMNRLVGEVDREQRETLRTGLEARHRMYGFDAAAGRDARVGSFVGRLEIAGAVSEQQAEAATRYLEIYQAMQISVGGPKASGAVNLNATKGMPAPENVAKSIQALADWRKAGAALQKREGELRGTGALIAAMDYCVIRGEDHMHMVEWLKAALSALALHFKIGDKRKKAA